VGVGRVGTVRVQILCPGVGFAAFVRARVSQFQHQRVKRSHGETCGRVQNTFLSRGLGLASTWQNVAQLAALDLPHTNGAVPARENATAATQSPCCGVSSSHEQKAQGAREGGEEEDSFHRRTVLRRAAQWSGPGRRSHALACAAPGAPDLSEEPDASQMAVCSGAPACPGVPGGQRTRAQSSARTQSVCPTLRGVVERVIGMRSSLVQEVSERAGVRHQAEE